ncbi:ArnT family glycosyltransferase [Nocardia sp. NBC_00511]|uniref:ArnT family glycosyltransferase n=1 Tax=Nocardia sp. NBC_00511 TaxID=2903591 RepID=UPI0030E4B2EB
MTTITGVEGDAVQSGESGGKQAPRWSALLLGPPGRPRWERPGTLALLVVTAFVYLWGLGGAGWGNGYYGAAVQSGTQSWKALLFASLDPQNSITVDKPPASMWVMGLSGRIFGFSSWSMFAPQAVMGVAAVALLIAAVRRWAGPAAGLLAGVALAVTPVAAMMFRFNNPDALMVLLLVAAAYCTVRSVDAPGDRWWSGSTVWLAGAGVLIGFGFLAKMMQAFLVLPGLALVVLVAGAGGWLTRISRLATAGLAVVVSAGWYVALVQVWPAGSRPYIGGSTDNSLWDLAMDYNGLGRILGNHKGGGGPKPTPVPTPTPSAVPDPTQQAPQMGHGWGGFGSQPGLTRLFHDELATEFSWLMPAALIALIAGLWLTRRGPRTDRGRAGLLLWGGWLLSTAAVLSTMSRGFHSYYVMELAPAVAAVAAIGATQLWAVRTHLAARATLALMSLGTGVWAFVLLHRTPDWLPWLRWTLVALAVIAAAVLLLVSALQRFAVVIGLFALVSALIGPTVYTLETVAQVHEGGSPQAGPPDRDDDTPSQFQQAMRGVSDPQVQALISGSDTRWAAAASGAQDVSSLELSTGKALMAVGGFSGRDDSPSLATFQQYVNDHQIGYFLIRERQRDQQGPQGGGQQSGHGGSDDSASAQITAWVKANFQATRIGNIEVYTLTS